MAAIMERLAAERAGPSPDVPFSGLRKVECADRAELKWQLSDFPGAQVVPDPD
jgi:hypothetical protein